MVQISTSFVVTVLLVVPAIATPFAPEAWEEVEVRDLQELEIREPRIHVHLPKIHLPKIHVISPSQFVKGLKEWGPKIAKTAFKIAKMVLREEGPAISHRSLSARDIDDMAELEELIARSPKKSLKKLLKTVKQMKKLAKASKKLRTLGKVASFAESAAEQYYGRDDLESESAILERALNEDLELDARDLDLHLEILERALNDMGIEEREVDEEIYAGDFDDFVSEFSDRYYYDPEFMERDDIPDVYDRDWERDYYIPEIAQREDTLEVYNRNWEQDMEVYEREFEPESEGLFGRQYADFEFEDLD
ncbi:hypothetical protein BDZ97DRAFT_1920037 [Flammula alnicola]|nr:hypothetical protein BDZ97DRAFT_1920037 [Flammula alnicola]